MGRRAGWFYFGVILAFAGILTRIFYLSLGENHAVAESVMQNRTAQITLYRTKGRIYDRSLEPLAGGNPCCYVVVNPRAFKWADRGTLIRNTEAEAETVLEKLKKETPFVLRCSQPFTPPEGCAFFAGEQRYYGISQHLVGYLDSAGEVGLSGVEREYDAFLSLFSAAVRADYEADAVNGVLPDRGVYVEETEISENGLILTLDKPLCTCLEESIDRKIPVGAAVVLDCRTGELLAAASRPGYNESRIADYLTSTGGELINRVFSAQTVGSVFKIVVAACAFEQGLQDFVYDCGGGITIRDHTFACHAEGGHGSLHLKEAFALSCNAYFIALGQIIGYEKILETAERLGFGEAIPVLGDMTASGGTLPQDRNSLALANFSIGQGDLSASPLQIARLTAAVANGGVQPKISLYAGLYLGGNRKAPGEPAPAERVLSEEAAAFLRDLCIETVENGTGQAAKPATGGAGGKTASAQTGILLNGAEKLNVYFTGFYPAKDPRYAITVFAENGESGGKTCAPVFREICDFLAKNPLTPLKTVIY